MSKIAKDNEMYVMPGSTSIKHFAIFQHTQEQAY